MRRSLSLFACPLLLASVAACEDGPNQTFSPATGNLFNDGDASASGADGAAPLNGDYGSTTKQEICSGAELQVQWDKMIHAPIRPPRFMAGLDLAAGETYDGLRIEAAELGPVSPIKADGTPDTAWTNPRLCQSKNLGIGGSGSDVGGSLVSAWGNNNEVQMEWAVPTHKAYILTLNPGYVGTMEWDYTTPSDKTKHHYIFQIGKPIFKDGQVFTIHWDGDIAGDVDELYKGIVSTFAPDIYVDTPTTCQTNGTCLINPSGNQDGTGRTVIGFRPAAFYFQTYTPTQPQPSGSTMGGAYVFNVKYAPYSVSTSLLKMNDVEGPTSTVNPIGDLKKNCLLKLGDKYGDLVSNCIQVYSDKATNDTALHKVLGNLAHDDQNYTFSVVGINQNYRAHALDTGQPREFDVIGDNDTPQPEDTADDFQADVRTYGPILNDKYQKADGTYKSDYHGSGEMFKEYQRLVQTDLAASYHALHPTVPVRALHDPACLFPNPLPPNFDVYAWRAPEGCTGFEGFMTQGPPDGPDDVFNSPSAFAALWGSVGANVGGFKPGGPSAVFCNDPGTYTFCGENGDIIGLYTDLLVGSLQRVTQFMGNGEILNVPPEGRDLRYYFKQFSIAMAKYMVSPEAANLGPNATAAGGHALNQALVTNQFIDTDYLIFDSYGGGASRSEYVELAQTDATHDPTSLELKFLLVGSNWQSTHFYRRLDREERAFFNAMSVDKTQPSWSFLKDSAGNVLKDGAIPRHNADMFLSNIFGAPAIAGGPWTAPADANGKPIPVGGVAPHDPCNPSLTGADVVKTAYYCATHVDADCAGAAAQAPTDDAGNIILRDNGRPLLDGYCGIWNETEFTIDALSDMELVETYPLKQAAKVRMQNHANPYDQGTDVKPIEVLVPWKPQQEGVGFPVATTGTRDVFVETAQLDFTGQVITPVIDFIPQTIQVDGGAPVTKLKILGVETEDFIGDVFVCYDKISGANRFGTGRPGDILTAHMYTSVQIILDWIQKHPGAQDACGLIIRYSPFNNYPDFIQSSVNGVRLNIEQGAGFGRVSDVTIFAPGTGNPAAP